jgi:hypothetical protein
LSAAGSIAKGTTVEPDDFAMAILGAGHAGPGWVRVVNREERWIVSLTAEGRAAVPADCRARCGP